VGEWEEKVSSMWEARAGADERLGVVSGWGQLSARRLASVDSQACARAAVGFGVFGS
jgi:hypothetical protein